MTKTIVGGLLLSIQLAFPAVVSAAQPNQSSASAYAIILGGGKTMAEAEEAARHYRTATALTVPQGFPRLTASRDIPGLNAGFMIAVAGYCSVEEHARMVRDMLNFEAPGVYIKKVAVAASPETCPTIRGGLRTAWSGYQVNGTRTASFSDNRFSWESLATSGRCPRAGLRLKWGSTLVASRAFEGDQCEPNGTKVWFTSRPFEVGQRLLWLVTKTTDWVDNAEQEYFLVGFACGEIRDLYVVSWPGNPVEVQIKSAGADRDDWKNLAVTIKDESSHILWDPAGCRYTLEGAEAK